MSWSLAVDLGASGSRIARARDGRAVDEQPLAGPATGSDAAGSIALTALTRAVELARAAWPELEREGIAGFAAGAAGFESLVPDPRELASRLRALVGAPVAVTSDVVTSHLGALAGEGGAVLAAGTGAIAYGTDHVSVARRSDGWGHIVGDLGSGAWIGMEALRAAAAQHDGRRSDAAVVLELAQRELGPVPGWPAQIYTRHDRSRVIASVVPALGAAAAAGDPVSRDILRRAAEHLADTLAAALVPGVPPVAALTGGLLGLDDAVFGAVLRARLAGLRPEVALRPAAGGALDGALLLAREVARPGFSMPLVTFAA